MKIKVAVLCLGLLLAGCGFRPLYAQREELLDQIQTVQVDPIAGEGGYKISLILKDKLNPEGNHSAKKYRLAVTLNQPKYTNQSIRSDNFASLEQMKLSASYELIRIADGEKVIASSVSSNGLFNLIKDPYATTVAREKLYDNLLQLIAEDIANHILSYFKGEAS